MQIAVFGAGSIGCYLGGCLAARGATVHFIGRPKVKEAIERRGLTLTDWQGRKDQVFIDDINFYTSPEGLYAADIIFVTVKGTGTQEAATSIKQHAKKSALIVSFQNGIRNGQLLKDSLPGRDVLTGMVPFNVINDNNSHFHCGTEGKLCLETLHGKEKCVADTLTKAGLSVELKDDMTEVQWGKLLLNLNNSINALAGIPLLDELQDRNYRRVLAGSISEALAVMAAEGITPQRLGKLVPTLIPKVLNLPTWLFQIVARAMLTIDPKAKSSMQEDLTLGRMTEVDLLNGEIILLAQKHGMQVPINERITALIKEAEKAANGSPKITGKSLWDAVSAQKSALP
jgi:2-dehydropantoate 2-reductase